MTRTERLRLEGKTDTMYFGIGNANKFGFTASWLLIKNNEPCMRVETKDNSYLV